MQEKPNNFGPKYGNQENITMDEQHLKRIRSTRRRSETENTRQFTQNNTKKYMKLQYARQRWNTWILVQEIHLHSQETSTRN